MEQLRDLDYLQYRTAADPPAPARVKHRKELVRWMAAQLLQTSGKGSATYHLKLAITQSILRNSIEAQDQVRYG